MRSAILNDDPTLRGFAAHVDTMHPDLWLDEALLQIISLTTNGVGGPNEAETTIAIRKANGQTIGTKGVRPTLVLAGDVNLDGKVDALDLQASIAQLGTNPQAVGVMPLADLNGDGIVDTHDVVLLLQDFGEETDIYEGLWDGSRLLFTVGANAGFGDLVGVGGVGGVGGVAVFGPGPRPVDDCVPKDVDMPPDAGLSLLPWLLRGDAARNCFPCPSYDDVPGCYTCYRDKSISGGSVHAQPSQPLVNESVTFTASGVREIPGQLQCDVPCGSDGRTAPTPTSDPLYYWAIYTKDQNGWPTESDPNDFWPIETGPSVTIAGGSACEEVRAVCWARPTGCISERPWKRIGDAEVKFADFVVDVEFEATTPEIENRRRVGINEIVFIEASTLVDWEIYIDEVLHISMTSQSTEFQAPFLSPGQTASVKVIATKNGCSRTETFQVVTPSSIRFERRPSRDYHTQGIASAGFGACVTILPDDVSFIGLYVGEHEVEASVRTGNFTTAPGTHQFWRRRVQEHNLVQPTVDFPAFWQPLSGGEDFEDSFFVWVLPWFYDENDNTPGNHVFTSMIQVHHIDSSGGATIFKGGVTVDFGLHDPSINSSSTHYGPSWSPVVTDCE